MIEGALNFAELSEGRKIGRVLAQTRVPVSLSASSVSVIVGKSPRWTAQEDSYLRKNLGWLSEEEMAVALGRTPVAVKLRWKRDLRLPAPSRHPDFLTGQQAAQLVGLDQHQITHWCDAGLIRHRVMAGGRKIRLIPRLALTLFIVNPENWIYFDWRKLADAHLRRLCELRAERWGDEWWTTPQVAEYHGVDTGDVKRLIARGEIPGVQTLVSRCGRYKGRAWANWYVKRSDAVQACFRKGRGSGHDWEPSERARAWMTKAIKSGMSICALTRTMRGPCHETVRKRLFEMNLLKKVNN
jgi:hypothetical protein